jgi:hypothetical protein
LFRSFFIDGVLSYALGELMINYSCGFIRRGLLGSIFSFLSSLFNAHIFDVYNYATLLAQLLLFAYLAVRLYAVKLANIFFLASPVGILFVINNWGVFGFKDVFILLYCILILVTIKYNFKNKNGLAFLTLIIGGLMHEPFLFFSAPFILLALNLNNPSPTFNFFSKQNVFFFITLFAITIFLFFTNANNAIKTPCLMEKAMAEKNSYHKEIKGEDIDYKGPIDWLNKDLNYGIKKASRNYIEPFLLKWSIFHFCLIALDVFLIVFILFHKHDILDFFNKYKYWMLYTIFSFSVLYYIAVDWGRWLYLIAMHLLILLAVNKNAIVLKMKKVNNITTVFFSFLLLVQAVFFIPHFYYSDWFVSNPYNTVFYRMLIRVIEVFS